MYLPDLNLLGYFFRARFFCGRATDDEGSFPLGTSHVESPDFSLGGYAFSYAIEMGFLPSKGHARPSIDAELNHLKPIIEQEAAETGGGFALRLRHNGKVKRYDKPSHFEFFHIHGR